jgi:hypothetical protein
VNFMSSSMSDRLKKARVSAGFYKASDAITKFGWKASTYRAHESRQNQFDAATALNYARAYGVNAGWLLTGEGEMSARYPEPAPRQNAMRVSEPERRDYNEAIIVKGSVGAGVWLEDRLVQERHEDAPRSIFPADPNYPIEAQHDYGVVGTSADRIGRHGDFLRCVDFAVAGIEPQDGDVVVVERRGGVGLKELSVRRVMKLNDGYELAYLSNDPLWQGRQRVVNGVTGEGQEIRLLAKVVWRYSKV